MNIGENIKTLRLQKGFTQEELGNLVGLKKAAIQKYEKGTVENIKRSTILSLAHVLETTPCDLMGWSDDSSKNNNMALSKSEETLLENYNKLNDLGKNEATKRVIELTEISRYTSTEKQTYLDPIAAHDKDGNFSDEDKQHDLNIMKDENF